MPQIKMWPMRRDHKGNRENLFRTDIDTYVCPVYLHSNRTDLIYIFDIPPKSLSMKARHWALRSVCPTTIEIGRGFAFQPRIRDPETLLSWTLRNRHSPFGWKELKKSSECRLSRTAQAFAGDRPTKYRLKNMIVGTRSPFCVPRSRVQMVVQTANLLAWMAEHGIRTSRHPSVIVQSYEREIWVAIIEASVGVLCADSSDKFVLLGIREYPPPTCMCPARRPPARIPLQLPPPA
jgi:hypothetical protein